MLRSQLIHVNKRGLNSLAPGKFFLWNFSHIIFKQILVIDGWVISCELALGWMSLDLTDDKSTLVQVMAWCRQATSHYLSQCWPTSLSLYGATRPQWVNILPKLWKNIEQKLCWRAVRNLSFHDGWSWIDANFVSWSWIDANFVKVGARNQQAHPGRQ